VVGDDDRYDGAECFPMVLLFTAIKRKQGASASPSVEVWIFSVVIS